MRLLQFIDPEDDGQVHVGLVEDGEVVDLSRSPDAPHSVFEVYYDRGGDEVGFEDAVERLVAGGEPRLQLSELMANNRGSAPHLTKPVSGPAGDPHALRVWLAGVTHADSAKLREIEAKQATGDQVNVYEQKYRESARGGRPELFSKADPEAVLGHLGALTRPDDTVRLVPETELVSVYGLNRQGQVERLGYTGGNDLTDNGIEAANPLNLPQAKNWAGGCASLGPLLVTDAAFDDGEVEVSCEILREGQRAGFKQGLTGQAHLNMPTGLFHMEQSLFSRIPLLPRQLQVLYWGTPIVFADADLEGGLQTGDLLRLGFSGGIGTLENRIAELPNTGQLDGLRLQMEKSE